MQNAQPLHKMRQLTHVAGPGPALQRLHSSGGEERRRKPAPVHARGERGQQQGDILGPIPQGRQAKRKHSQPIIQVSSEFTARNSLLKVFVGRGNDAHVHLERMHAPHALKTLFLKNAQNLGLGLEAHIPDFVKEQRAFVRQFKLARP